MKKGGKLRCRFESGAASHIFRAVRNYYVSIAWFNSHFAVQ